LGDSALACVVRRHAAFVRNRLAGLADWRREPSLVGAVSLYDYAYSYLREALALAFMNFAKQELQVTF
jgi:hypothetical protein